MEEERKSIVSKTDLIGGIGHGCVGCRLTMSSHFECKMLAAKIIKKMNRQQVLTNKGANSILLKSGNSPWAFI